MVLRGLILAAVLFAAGLTNAQSQNVSTTPQDLAAHAHAQATGCQRACQLEHRTCVIASGERDSPGCDTALIRCGIHCQDCVSTFVRCRVESKNSSAQHCTQAANVCQQQFAHASENPLSSITFHGGDGSSLERAVVIKGARNMREGAQAQSLWVAKTFWGWRQHQRSHVKERGRAYDRIEYRTPKGERKMVFFDVSEFHEKF